MAKPSAPPSHPPLTNADIARRLGALAQLLASQGENPYKVRAYRRAAETIASLPESVDELVRTDADLTQFSGIGKGMSSAIRELVLTGGLQKLTALRTEASPELAALSEYPRLDPKRALRAFKQLGVSTVEALKEKLESGELGKKLGSRMEQHVRDALRDDSAMLISDADGIVPGLQRFLIERCGASRAEPVGAVRRRVEIVEEISFLIETADFAAVVAQLRRFGGAAEVIEEKEHARVRLKLSSGAFLTVHRATRETWGLALVLTTGAEAHLAQLNKPRARLNQLARANRPFATEGEVYEKLGLHFIPPELREGHDEIKQAAKDQLPALVTLEDIRGDLHAHTTASDGAHSLEQMAAAARERGYTYLGITDHSQSLKIAGGVSEADLWKQIRRIDRLNEKLAGIRLLKSAEVDIHADGRLDYPDELLRELDYTVCSIHSRFALGKAEQTERILRAMDNPYFNILGHATGRLLLRRPGYEIDVERVIAHAKAVGCFFEINSSPDRLDLSAENARLAREAGVKIAICTDAHSVRELDFIQGGIDQARRAGLDKVTVLNCLSWPALRKALKR